jgi:tetratricopeptide (TPR) repeat protein
MESIQQRPTENLTAYDLYLRGQALYELLHEKDNEKAITLFRQALEADPKFALGYVGLANAYIERANRFEAGNFWLDSAIDLCRKAIDLDPTQVRGYVVLARALTSKFLRKEAEEPIRKALELAPNDEYANIQASKQFIDTDRFVDWYAAVRKCHALNPNRTYEPYTLATICAIVGDNVLMEKWMQRAITLEDDPARLRMLECERNIFRREYGKALAGFEQLPSDLMTVGPRAVEQLVGCAQRLGDWLKVLRLTKAQIEKGGEDRWAFFNLALALRALGREAEARQKMERVVALAREGLAINEQDVYAREFLAFASRFLDRKEEAYEHLRMIFPGILEDAPLLRDDYIWDMFMPDAEFQNMIIDFDKKNQINRARIREIEKSS